ncbi:restriction endonuclease subunit S [Serratia marcescens]|uniref:restriction endonuclease subunit S n=1 Tax=Serratia TaxID=613 RepID=UPI000745129F|nr:restriction endonuclease subunit S [Serratia marcescens]MBH1906900.1 restriction endonuclease subunit S [Serratia marcescens]MBH2607371.1 restriction endonuclease subunit S [Serratia marcescens]MCS3413007.1 restriction endonuclease subunit S [Serratia marcescens]NCI81742.1 restriction endonuclease subunit S [Serratia marcescens]NDI95197.1 restriction endonuclease subunit S [Serratia marcescens]
MAKYKAYPEYKDSGVQSVGIIPHQWSVLKLKYIFEIKKRIAGAIDYDVLSVTQKGIKIKDIESGEGQLSMDYSKYQRVYPGDFAMNHMDLLTGYVDISNYDGVTSPDYRVFSVRDIREFYSRYYLYLLQDGYKQRRFFHLGQGSAHLGRWRLPTEAFNEIQYPCPSLEEQLQIATFLDHETAKIDNLIDKQQQLIELLKEKRQAVISHAVTKGLNPDVPMKDSGVEWLGKVPEHWSIKSYRYACLIYRGKFGHRPRNDPSLYDGDYAFIQTGDVARASKFIETYSQTLNEKGKAVSQLFPSGTLMMAIAANIGDTAILGFEAYAPDSVVGFKPYQSLHLEFLRYSFMAALPALEQTSTQSTQANLNIDRIGAVKAVFPPLEEQLDIIDYLDDKLCLYDSIEENANQTIRLLQERRTALISAAVTGKIDVRDWAAPDMQDAEEPQETTA